MRTWKYSHPHDPLVLTMHDCAVTRIDLEDGGDTITMTRHFPDGIW